MDFLKYNYVQFYENLVAGKISFEDFMNYTNDAFNMGKEIGSLEGQSQAISRMSNYIESVRED